MKNKRITHVATIALILCNVGLFAMIWLDYYNAFAFRSHRPEGAVGAIAAYYVIYRWLSKLYRGYAIASSGIDETVLSQFISFGISDLALYVACCLLRRNYVSVLPGAGVVLAQLVGTTLIVWIAKRYLLSHIEPDRTLLIYGGKETEDSARRFADRLQSKYGHLFDVCRMEPEDRTARELFEGIAQCERVIFFGVSSEKRALCMERCLDEGKVFFFVPEFEDIICRSCTVKNFLDTPLMRYDYSYKRNRNYVLKRAFDVVLSMLFLVVFAPVMLVVAVCIKAEDGGPVFYKQERVTQNGRRFSIFKFRSMVVDAEKYGARPATADDPRITRVGRVIRKTRIDETPQVLNVLLGQMSLVGPRPESSMLVQLYEKEVPEFRYRHRVKGGLTGYAQVYGKYNTTPEDKLKLDMLYIENQSFLLDFKLILLTIKTMFTPESTEGFDKNRSRDIFNRTKKAG